MIEHAWDQARDGIDDNGRCELTAVDAGAYCGNRGGVGGSNSMSTNLGSLAACAAFVRGNADCGAAFSYAAADGWCDCVPPGCACAALLTRAEPKACYAAPLLIVRRDWAPRIDAMHDRWVRRLLDLSVSVPRRYQQVSWTMKT